MSAPAILVVEDDPAVRRGLVDALSYQGFRVFEREEGEGGLEAALTLEVELVLLDVLLPGLDGFEILQRLRAVRPTLPVIMVTARGAESDRVNGLAGGADDYVVKPFSARELLARVEAVLRRSGERSAPVETFAICGREVDLARREVRLPGGEVRALTEREAGILRFLVGHRGRAVDRSELLRHVWGLDPKRMHTRTIDMHIARLREKLEAGEDDPIILTVRSKGYMLAEST